MVVTITRAEICTNFENSFVKYENTKLTEPEKSKFLFTADIEILHDIKGHIEVHLESSRCNIDRSNCQNYDKMIIQKFCSILHDKSAPWTPLVQNISPVPNCPIQKVYTNILHCK